MKKEIAGILFTPIQCLKIQSKIKKKEIYTEMPLASITALKNTSGNSYRISITAFVPAKLNTIPEITASMIPLSTNPEIANKLALKYSGVVELLTEALLSANDGEPNDKMLKGIICRAFEVLYDTAFDKVYNLYYIVVDYKILNPFQYLAQAIVINDCNMDPETSRGTITTSSTSG